MKVKNISKKILGNGSFRLLPGESLNVSGNEAWVKNYLARKSLEAVTETEPAAASDAEAAEGKNATIENAEAAQAAAETGKTAAKTSAAKVKKTVK